MKSEKLTSYGAYLLPLIAAILLVVLESDVLYALQEQNLFLHTPLFFEQQMVKAGGLLTWMGSYLTQYFYYPMLGATLLCLLWAFFIWLSKRAFQLQNTWLTLIPTACLVLTITTLGYWVFFLKLQGHPFCATIGSIMAVASVWGYRVLPQRFHLPSIYLILIAGLGYPLFGFYALIATALIGIVGWREGRKVDSILAITQIAIWPLVGYYFYYHETNIVNIYWVGLPVFAHQEERFFAYNIPYIILFASIAMMAIRPNIKPIKWLNYAVIAIVAAGLFLFWNRDDNFHRELSMSRSIEQNDWQQVIKTAKEIKGEPTRAICTMRNLALFRLGRQGDEMFNYSNGAKRPNAPFSIHMVHTYGKMLYLQYGLANYCYRWCMEDGVEYGWKVNNLKLMTLCALVNNEKEAARKYISLLRKTTFHKSWAKQYGQLMRNPQLMASTPEIAPMLRMAQTNNFLTNDLTQAESFIIEFFSTTESNDPMIQEQALIAAIQTRNQKLFWPQFSRYVELHRGQYMPRHYQEAACLFGFLGNMDMSHSNFDPQVMSDYQEMAITMNRCHQQGIDIAKMGPYMSPHLRNTYYYNYYFNTYRYQEE